MLCKLRKSKEKTRKPQKPKLCYHAKLRGKLPFLLTSSGLEPRKHAKLKLVTVKVKVEKLLFSTFQLSVKIFFLLTGYPKSAFCTPWPRKRAPKNTIKIVVPAYFFLGKKLCVTKRPFFGQKNPNSEIPVIIFSCLFSFSKTKNTKIC